MGAYVSRSQCQSKYNVTLDCNYNVTHIDSAGQIDSLGPISKGQFQSDPDIAGAGIVGVFIAVTGLALSLSCIHLLWSLAKILKKWRHGELDREEHSGRASKSQILEKIILACSDQQVFTGGAYALTLRYWRGCDVSAYHYNVVSNMLLLSCATHLMSISLCSHYWKYPWISWLRVAVMTGVFVVTGILLSNQNSTAGSYFPTEVPPANQTASLLFMPAACFQSNSTSIIQTLHDSMDQGAHHFAVDVIASSSPKNHVRGWNFFILTMLWYAVALIVQIFKVIRHQLGEKSGKAVNRLKLRRPRSFPVVKWPVLLFGIYQTCGIALSFFTVAYSASYIMKLRTWVYASGWLELDNGKNPEDDPTSFGQLVPIFLCSLILFAFVDTVNEEVMSAREKAREKHGLADIEVLSTSAIRIPEKKPLVTVNSSPAPLTPSTIDFQPLYPAPTAPLGPYSPYTHMT